MCLKKKKDTCADSTVDAALSEAARLLAHAPQNRMRKERELVIRRETLASLANRLASEPADVPYCLNLQISPEQENMVALMRAYRTCVEKGVLQDRKVRWTGPAKLLRYIGTAAGKIFTGPRMVQINIANRCNLDCIFCWVHSPFAPPAPGEWKRTRITMPVFRQTVTGLGRIGTGGILFSGQGEPFTHPQIDDMISLVKQEDIRLEIQTNLHLVDVEKVAALGVDKLHVNLSAASEETYREVHPAEKPGSFKRLRQKLDALQEMRVKGRHAPEVEFIHVIHTRNYHEIPRMIELAADYDASGIFLKMMETNDHVLHLLPAEADRESMAERLKEAENLASRHGVNANFSGFGYQLSHVDDTGEFSAGLYDRIGCYMGWFFVRVNLDGNVSFCCKDKFLDRVTPSRSLSDIWHSVRYHHFRLIAKDMDFKKGKGFLDAKCRRCSNFNQNMTIHAILAGENA